MSTSRDNAARGERKRKTPTWSAVGSILLIAVALAVVLLAVRVRPAKARPLSQQELVARGRYLVTIAGCNDCHTPFKLGPNGPEPDMTRMLSGHPEALAMPEMPALDTGPWVWVGAGTNTAFAGPWGVSYAINLTPDENTGIGIWTEEIFINTLRSGRHWGVARPILPPMPWQNLAQMTDEDLRAMYAFLRTIPPVHNRVPQSQPVEGQ